MFGIFKKSPEKIATALFPVVMEVGDNIASHNFLQLQQGTSAHRRFVIGAHLFSNLMCQDMVSSADADKIRSLGVCKILTEEQIAAFSRSAGAPVAITEIVIWDDEIEEIRHCPINPKLIGADLGSVNLPVADIVRELHVVRLTRMLTDMMKGAAVMVQKGPGSLAFLMPVCSSLIMQTTADSDRAADEKTVAGLAASLVAQWMLLQSSVQEALK